MAGTLTIDTLKASSGVLATQNGMSGIAKAWVYFDGLTGSTATIKGSFNVSSVTYNAAGDYTVAYTTAMSNANYAASVTASQNYGVYSNVGTVRIDAGLPSTTSIRVTSMQSNTTNASASAYMSVTIFGA